jgi:hypothetical protein
MLHTRDIDYGIQSESHNQEEKKRHAQASNNSAFGSQIALDISQPNGIDNIHAIFSTS